MLNDDPASPEPEFVDFAYYAKVIPSGLKHPPRNIDEPRMWTLTRTTQLFP
jgi:uncharacterized membrane protein